MDDNKHKADYGHKAIRSEQTGFTRNVTDAANKAQKPAFLIPNKKYKAVLLTSDIQATRMVITEYYHEIFDERATIIVTDRPDLADLKQFEILIVVDDCKISQVRGGSPIPMITTDAPLQLVPSVLRLFIEQTIFDYTMSDLLPVTITKLDTCWTYCLKRTGYELTVRSGKNYHEIVAIHKRWLRSGSFHNDVVVSTDHNRIEESFDLLPLHQGENGLRSCGCGQNDNNCHPDCPHERYIQRGDLLLFTHREKKALLTDTIDVSGRLEHTMMKIYRHVAVYEGSGIISHLVAQYQKQGERDSYIGMQIECNTFGALENMPTHVLRPKFG